ncbi:MAG TPA: hypothetical protein VGO93_00200 [Candidatus Xenobia bacterium]|jgi:hypothetical protein
MSVEASLNHLLTSVYPPSFLVDPEAADARWEFAGFVEASPAGASMYCKKHGEESRRAYPPMRVLRVSKVILRRRDFMVATPQNPCENRHYWVGACRDCRTVYWAAQRPT